MSDDYASDTWLLKVFNGWFDPCPLYGISLRTSGLEIDWTPRTYVNPPYSQTLKWVEKAILENKKGCTVALMLKHDSSTKAWRLLHEAGAKFLMIGGRLQYQTGKPAPFPSVLVILEGD